MEILGLPPVAGEERPLAPSRPVWVSRNGRDGAMRRLLAAGDVLAISTATVLAMWLPPERAGAHHAVWALFALPLMGLLFKLYGLYDRDAKRISRSTVDDLPHLVHAIVIGTLLLWLYSRYTPLHRLDFAELMVFSVVLLVVSALLRDLARSISGWLLGRERALVVGGDEMLERFSLKLAQQPIPSLELVGSLTSPTDVEAVAGQLGVTRVVLSRELPAAELEQLLRDCRRLSLKVSLLPKLADLLGRGVEIEDVQGLTVLGVNPPWLPRSSRALKRAMDLVVAGAALLFGSPLLLVIAVAIKASSRGPVLFRQERVGRGGERFQIVKFRTMVADAEQRRAGLLADSRDPDWLLLDTDPRVTPAGRLLRRTSLDELPQLWNVMRGQMSLVGPRPLIPSEDERVAGWVRGRLDLTPGITGYWQVLGRTRLPFEEMVKLDYLYVMSWSLWEDVRLMLKTLPVVLVGRGAN